MQPESDAQLLRAYAERGAEAAFAELVHRHTNLVYSAAWRQVESAEAAAEIAQSVFIGLARGAQSLVPRLAADASLAGWLCRSARNLSLNHRRDEFRRQTRERQAMEQIIAIPDAAPDWNHLRRVLDDAMAELDEPDYDALVLRYFQQQDFRVVGAALGVSDDTAQKRVARALEKLRDQLSRRGISTPAAALSIVISANAVQAAPAGLAATISTAALLTGTAVHTSTVIAAIKTIAMTTLQKTLVTVTVAALAGAGIYEARQTAQLRDQNQTLQQSQAPLAEQNQQLRRERDDATNRLAGLLAENEQLKSHSNEYELLKLRGKVSANDPADIAAKDLVARVNKLKQRLEQTPKAKIPELQLLDEQDWLTACRGWNLDSENGVREALSGLRGIAAQKFSNLTQGALAKFAKANDKPFPTDLSQLQPYFDSPVDAAILQRWEILPAGATIPGIGNEGPLVTQKAPVDDLLDRRWAVGLWGSACTDYLTSEIQEVMKPVYQAYSAANNGVYSSDPSEYLPFATSSEQQAAIQKLLQQSAVRK